MICKKDEKKSPSIYNQYIYIYQYHHEFAATVFPLKPQWDHWSGHQRLEVMDNEDMDVKARISMASHGGRIDLL